MLEVIRYIVSLMYNLYTPIKELNMKIEITKPPLKEMEDKGVMSWSIWEKEVSRFDAFYDETEQCFLLEGKVVVETKDGSVTFGKGDFVTLPKGLECVWDIKEPVRKHYQYI